MCYHVSLAFDGSLSTYVTLSSTRRHITKNNVHDFQKVLKYNLMINYYKHKQSKLEVAVRFFHAETRQELPAPHVALQRVAKKGLLHVYVVIGFLSCSILTFLDHRLMLQPNHKTFLILHKCVLRYDSSILNIA